MEFVKCLTISSRNSSLSPILYPCVGLIQYHVAFLVDNAKDGPKIGEKYVNDEHQAKEEVSHVIGVPNMIFKVLYHPAERIFSIRLKHIIPLHHHVPPVRIVVADDQNVCDSQFVSFSCFELPGWRWTPPGLSRSVRGRDGIRALKHKFVLSRRRISSRR